MQSILGIIATRLALGVLTLWVISVIIFIAVNSLPGDFAQAILGQGATPEAVEGIRLAVGLDKPPVERYLSWLGGVAQGDFGTSFANLSFQEFAGSATGQGGIQSIAQTIGPRFENTMFLASVAALMSVPLSIFLGVLAALYRNSVFDRGVNIFALSSISSPEFFVSYLLIMLLAVLNPIFPAVSNIFDDMTFGERLHATMLPAIVLTLVVTAHMMRMTRAAIINLMASPYIEMARLKGVKPLPIIVKHALPNALAPVINVVALNLAYLVTGVVVVEFVFVYPGIGNLFVDAVRNRDVPVVQVCCLIFGAAYILLNLTADVMAIVSNPRLRHPK